MTPTKLELKGLNQYVIDSYPSDGFFIVDGNQLMFIVKEYNMVMFIAFYDSVIAKLFTEDAKIEAKTETKEATNVAFTEEGILRLVGILANKEEVIKTK